MNKPIKLLVMGVAFSALAITALAMPASAAIRGDSTYTEQSVQTSTPTRGIPKSIAPADTTAPVTTVFLTFMDEYTFDPVAISYTATDNVGLSKIELYRDAETTPYYSSTQYADGTPVGTSGVFKQFTEGQHTVYSKSYDLAGNVGQSDPITFYVDKTAPTGAITSPANNSTFVIGDSVTVNAADNTGVVKVDFWKEGDTKPFATDYTAPFRARTPSLGEGQKKIYAIITDRVGNETTTAIVTVNATYLANTLTSPTNNTTVSGVVNIAADVKSSNGVQKVEFYIDNQLVLTDTNGAPYTYSWDTNVLFDQTTHTIYTKAYDIYGVTTVSPTVTVVVSNPALPSVALNIMTQNSGETLTRGNTYDVKWYLSSTQAQAPNTAAVILQKDGSTISVLNPTAGTTVGLNSYSWNVPTNLTPGKYKILVQTNQYFNTPKGYERLTDLTDQEFTIQ